MTIRRIAPPLAPLAALALALAACSDAPAPRSAAAADAAARPAPAPSLRAALDNAARPAPERARDAHRHPGETLAFFGLRDDIDAKSIEATGYVTEAEAIRVVEAAGFRLAGRSEINANPKDTKDHPGGVWTLPPTFALRDRDRAKYEAVGESDRMTLKFVKP